MNPNWSDIFTQIISKLPDVFLIFVGAVLAIIGGLISDWRKERREKKLNEELLKAACRLVGLEFGLNQKLLDSFWKEAQEVPKHGMNRKSLNPEIEPARGIALTPLPVWHSEEWETNKLLLSRFLKQDRFEQVYDFYISFERLRILHGSLVDMEKEFQERLTTRRHQLKEQWDQTEDQWKDTVPQFSREDARNAAAPMRQKAPGLYQDFKESIERLIRMSNPLIGC